MKIVEKQILLIILILSAGICLVFSGATEIIHNYSAQNLKQIIEKNDNAEKLTESLGYTVELIIATIFLITPLCGISAVWYLKIAYELLIGKNAHVNVFLIHPFCNLIVGILCFILFIYCLFSQYQWAIKLTEPKQKITNDKDLTRFI